MHGSNLARIYRQGSNSGVEKLQELLEVGARPNSDSTVKIDKTF